MWYGKNMKCRELLDKWPMQFLVWNLNEDTNVFWSDLSTLEDNNEGILLDPWAQRINLKTAKRITNSPGDTIEYQVSTEFQGYPIDLVILNE